MLFTSWQIVTKYSVISKADVSVLTSDVYVYLYKQNSENTLLSGYRQRILTTNCFQLSVKLHTNSNNYCLYCLQVRSSKP